MARDFAIGQTFLETEKNPILSFPKTPKTSYHESATGGQVSTNRHKFCGTGTATGVENRITKAGTQVNGEVLRLRPGVDASTGRRSQLSRWIWAADRKDGLPIPFALALWITFNESIGAFLIGCGFLTRLLAASAALGMAGALYTSVRLGEDWLRAALYLIVFTVLA